MLGLKQDKYGEESNLLKVIPLCMEGLENVTRRKLPTLNRVVFGELHDCLVYRIIVGGVFGFVVGIFFYEWVIYGIALPRATVYILGVVFTILLSIGCALSSQIRCMTWLTFPSFFGKAGRHMVQALIISVIMSKPFPNIIDNVEEIMRMYSCSNAMAHNLSNARYELLVKPFKIAFLNTKLESEELKDMMGSVNNVVEPFAQEIEGVDDIKLIQEENDYMDKILNDTRRGDEIEKKYSFRDTISKLNEKLQTNDTETATDAEQTKAYQDQYYKKLETRCENVKTEMGKACKKRFSSFKDKCEAAIYWAVSWAICWPMKLDVICDIVKMFTYGGYDCDPHEVVSDNIGKGYSDLKNAPDSLKKRVIEERIQYKLIKPPNFVDLHSVVSITKEFAHYIYVKKNMADAVLIIVRTLLAFLFVLVIWSAESYHKNYMNYTDFDNKYITADFRMLDARRHKYNKPTLFPQTKVEKQLTIDPYSVALSPLEMSAWNRESWIVISFIIACTVVVAIAYFLSRAMDWMHTNLEFSYSEEGKHQFKIEVEGIGFVASLVRSIIQSFNFNKEVKGEVSNRACLPIPKRLVMSDYIQLYGTCVLLFILTYAQGYLKRLRRAICAFFYREQEKRRIETFYRKNLCYRQRLFQGKIEEIIKRILKNELMFSESLLYRLSSRLTGHAAAVLRLLPAARARCVICSAVEPYSGPKHILCKKCNFHYCMGCWINFQYSCLFCIAMNQKENLPEHFKYYV